ncbi:methylmalonyl Co-A mutase-associated GTPase MeaB [Aquihabitans daechungensis]|uniref:methylmalonyl Co-A mutase-associated GTPase MeaB n=1 Tax=Aquihabitans daechungensis TaxID=1052257 RepID=UPI003B9F9A95
MTTPDQLEAARRGDRRALARLLTSIERGDDASHALNRAVFSQTGSAYTVGLTGAPGAGKSTLTSAAVAAARDRGERVAVLAIDPSSPFSGGALLGDRTRMNDHALDDGVFIRSMATRGHLGGLALATREAIRLLDAVGFPWVLVETVGVGQVEVEVAGAADTTVVVVNPGWGDSVQANKAGLMEIADVFVVNKADRPGASQTVHDLESMLDLTRGSGAEGWRPPVVSTVGTTGDGAVAFWDAVGAHRAHLEATGELERRRQQRLREELALVVEERIRAEADARLGTAARQDIERDLLAGRLDPWSAADRILGDR